MRRVSIFMMIFVWRFFFGVLEFDWLLFVM